MQGFLKCFGATKSNSKKRCKKLQRSLHDHDREPSKNKVIPELEYCSVAVAEDGQDHSSDGIRKFSWEEIEKFTSNFCSSRVIGFGGFGAVYLADLDLFPSASTSCSSTLRSDSGLVAVKIVNRNSLFKQEFDILQQLHHGNIIGLIGYCDDRDDQGAIVLEYISNGSLEEKLHGGVDRTSTSQHLLPWRKRMKIAFQVAEALEYLHKKCGSLPIVHGDIKASNVLLDHNLNCRLCDFGSASIGFSSAVTPRRKPMMMGSPGYTDPHYLRTGIPSKKNDVYSFGVLLLELVTGMQAFCPESCRALASLVEPMLGGDDVAVVELVDPRLGGEFEAGEAKAMLSLAGSCLRHLPTQRPSTSQMLQTLKDKLSLLP